MKSTIDEKILALSEITSEFLFKAYYSHENAICWKINNEYSEYNKETFVLCKVEDGIEKALDLAIKTITEKKNIFSV